MVALNYQRRKRLLWAINIVLGAAALASAGLPLILPLARQENTIALNSPVKPKASLPRTFRKSLDAYAIVYNRDLRRPLFDPEPVPTVKPKINIPSLGVR